MGVIHFHFNLGFAGRLFDYGATENAFDERDGDGVEWSFFEVIAIQWENGLGGLGRFERIFFEPMLKIRAQQQQNPFKSAQSAQSVLSSYRFYT